MSIVPGLLARWNATHTAWDSQSQAIRTFFAEIEKGIKADQDALRDVIRILRIEEKVRKTVPSATEKVGCARMIVAGDEPDSLELVLALEASITGVTGKELMWSSPVAMKLPPLTAIALSSCSVGRKNKLSGLKPNGYRRAARHLQELFA